MNRFHSQRYLVYDGGVQLGASNVVLNAHTLETPDGAGQDTRNTNTRCSHEVTLNTPTNTDICHFYTRGSAKLSRTRDREYRKRLSRRLVCKKGECNIYQKNIKQRHRRFLVDIFTTMVDMRWRWNITIFIMAFILSWLVFASLWWLIAFNNGDTINYQNQTQSHQPCVTGVYDFSTALLFSIETQHTIGYGSRNMTPECVEALIMLMIQCCFGVIINALMTGLVFAKLSRAKKRAFTLMFSKQAVVCQRDCELYLLFRVGDMRKSHIISATIRALLIKKRKTAEGEIIPLYQQDVALSKQNTEKNLFLIWPVVIEHHINKDSPFWDMSPEALSNGSFELLVILEGVGESTGMVTQARTSYLPGEILWGRRFERLLTYLKNNGEYRVDYSRFDATLPVKIPWISAKKLAEMRTQCCELTPEEDHDNASIGVPEPVSHMDYIVNPELSDSGMSVQEEHDASDTLSDGTPGDDMQPYIISRDPRLQQGHIAATAVDIDSRGYVTETPKEGHFDSAVRSIPARNLSLKKDATQQTESPGGCGDRMD